MIRGKSGQVYIFVAIILLAFAFTVSRPPVPPEPKSDTFKELHRNFRDEGSIVVNNAVYENANVSARFIAFADEYALYARNRAPKFKFLFILKDGNSLLVGNRLGVSVNVSLSTTSYDLNSGGLLTLSPQPITIDVEGIEYDFVLGSETYGVKGIFRIVTDLERRVFVVS